MHATNFPEDTDGDGRESDAISATHAYAVVDPTGYVLGIRRQSAGMREEGFIQDDMIAWQRNLPKPSGIQFAKK
jgi:hypothetical protein